jgi:hypothetical protein
MISNKTEVINLSRSLPHSDLEGGNKLKTFLSLTRTSPQKPVEE